MRLPHRRSGEKERDSLLHLNPIVSVAGEVRSEAVAIGEKRPGSHLNLVAGLFRMKEETGETFIPG